MERPYSRAPAYLSGAQMSRLVDHIPQVGTVEWIGVSSSRRSEIDELAEVVAEVGTGLVGDRHAVSGTSKRQVTLIQAEFLPVISALSGADHVTASLLRRNVVVRGVNLYALRDQPFQIGDVKLRGTGHCHPCDRMEENLGPGGYQAMRGLGGITAIIEEGGTICLGDLVAHIPGGPGTKDRSDV
jgi:MOSC domain-containing protein YiiM